MCSGIWNALGNKWTTVVKYLSIIKLRQADRIVLQSCEGASIMRVVFNLTSEKVVPSSEIWIFLKLLVWFEIWLSASRLLSSLLHLGSSQHWCLLAAQSLGAGVMDSAAPNTGAWDRARGHPQAVGEVTEGPCLHTLAQTWLCPSCCWECWCAEGVMASDELSLDDVQKGLREAQQKVGCDHGNGQSAAGWVGQNKAQLPNSHCTGGGSVWPRLCWC